MKLLMCWVTILIFNIKMLNSHYTDVGRARVSSSKKTPNRVIMRVRVKL